MPTNERASQMREFSEGRGLMTNARCLTEGVDLPAIDCVVFTDPKRSRVDIVQAAGRALRLSKGKKFGYILLPLIVPKNESASKAAKDTAFEEIVTTLKALASQDSRIVDYLRAVSSGSKPKGGSPVDGLLKINTLSKINENEFNKSITLQIWNRVSFGSYIDFEEAKKIIQSEKLNSHKEFRVWSKTKRKVDFPGHPDQIYDEFSTWGDFLGTNNYSTLNLKKMPWKKLLDISRKSGCKKAKDWPKWIKKNQYKYAEHLMAVPEKYKEWRGWAYFLGNRDIRLFLSYSDAKKVIHPLSIKSEKEFHKYKKNKFLPEGIPLGPDDTYRRGKSWKGWQDFLGYNFLITKKNVPSYKSAKQIIKASKISIDTVNDYRKYYKKINKSLPADPRQSYKRDFISWMDYLGRKKIFNRFEFGRATYKECKIYAKKNKIKTSKEWKKLKKPKKYPQNIQFIYSEWTGWYNFLDTKPDDRHPFHKKNQ